MRRALPVLLVLVVAVLAAATAPSQAGGPKGAGPQDGTVLAYDLRSSGGAPDGSFRTVTEARLTLRHAGGTWTATCTGTTTTTVDGVASDEAFATQGPLDPPRMPSGLRRGDEVDPTLLGAAPDGCRHDLGPLVVAGRARDGSKDLLATEPAEASSYQDASLTWQPRGGLVTSWSFAGHGGGFAGSLASR